MSDPRRWLEDPSLTDDERRVLRAGKDIERPGDVRERLFASILAAVQFPPGGGGAGSGSGGAAGAGAAKALTAAASATGAKVNAGAGATAIVKSFAAGAAVAVATIVGHQLVAERPPSAVVTAPVRSASSATVPPRPSVAGVIGVPVSAPAALDQRPLPVVARVIASSLATAEGRVATDGAAPAVSEAPLATPQDASDLAVQESLLVARARRQVRSGRGAEALVTLDELARTSPHGVFGQEREALTIEALGLTGRRTEAASRAKVFLGRFPNSPHASHVAAFAGE